MFMSMSMWMHMLKSMFMFMALQGGPMAANLIKAGLPVLVFDRNPAAVQKLTRLGAKEAGSPQEIGSTPGVIDWGSKAWSCCCTRLCH